MEKMEVGERGSLPLGWALYLPEEWCEDLPRRREAKVPDEISFRTKPERVRAGDECAVVESAVAAAPKLAVVEFDRSAQV